MKLFAIAILAILSTVASQAQVTITAVSPSIAEPGHAVVPLALDLDTPNAVAIDVAVLQDGTTPL